MNTKALIIAAASLLAACSSSNRTLTLTIDQQKLKDTSAANITKQLESINYPATVTYEGDTVNIRVGAASVPDVRRAMCRQMEWPSAEGKMVRLADTFAFLRLAGITKVKIIGDAGTVDVELEKGGRCRKN
jgi:ABC-type uncharacterized transport system auxiliary subunit